VDAVDGGAENRDATCRTPRGKCKLWRPTARAGIHILCLLDKIPLGELDTLARLVKVSLLKCEDPAEPCRHAWGRRDFWRTRGGRHFQ